MLTFALLAGLGLALALLFAIYFKLDGLPLRVWGLAQKDRDESATKALDAMKEAVAAKAGASVVAIQRYEENIGAAFRAQVAEAQTRARMSERRMAESETALQAALSLVRELRATLDVTAKPCATRILPLSVPPPAEPESAEREMGEIAVPRAAIEEEDLGDDEKTRVGRHPCIPPPSGREESRSGDRGGAS